jgi:hypothetical protein
MPTGLTLRVSTNTSEGTIATAPLTNAEMDGNFIFLKNKIASATELGNIKVDNTTIKIDTLGVISAGSAGVNTSAGSTNTYLSTNTFGGTTTFTATPEFKAGIDISGPTSVSVYGDHYDCGIGIVNTNPADTLIAGLYAVSATASIGAWIHTAKLKSVPVSLVLTSGQPSYASSTTANPAALFMACNTSTTTSLTTPTIVDTGVMLTKFAVFCDGVVAGGTTFYNISADYAEFFEWKDLNPMNEDRVGYCVVLDGNMIRKHLPTDNIDDIIGVISGTGAVIGNSAEFSWAGEILRDDFGRKITEDVQMAKWTDVNGVDHIISIDSANATSTQIPTSADRYIDKIDKINPDWDQSKNATYISRVQRAEWGIVGLLGQVWIRNDQQKKPEWKSLSNTNPSATLYLIK